MYTNTDNNPIGMHLSDATFDLDAENANQNQHPPEGEFYSICS